MKDVEVVTEPLEDVEQSSGIGAPRDRYAKAGALRRHVITENSPSNSFDEHPIPF
jgi:hypothetical protein